MPVLDSSFIMDLIRKKEEALQKLSELEDEYSSMSTTEINILELYRGAYLSTKINNNLEQVKDILKGFQSWNWTNRFMKYTHLFQQV